MYISTTEAAEILNVSTARVRYLLAQGRVEGAYKVANIWIIPTFAGKPIISRGSRGPKPKWPRRNPAKTIVHVNKNIIAQNKNLEELKPVITTKHLKSNTYGHSVKIYGPCEIIYQPEDPLGSGAVVWVQTHSKVEIKRRKNSNIKTQVNTCVINAA